MNPRPPRNPAAAGTARRLLLVLLLLAGAGGSRRADAAAAAGAAAAPASAAGPLSGADGNTLVQVDAAAQARAGLVVQPLAAADRAPGRSAHGVVVDLQPLLDWQSRLREARGRLVAAAAADRTARAEAERSAQLYEDDRNLSLKSLQQARAAAAQAAAAAGTAQGDLAALQQEGNLRFGAALVRLAARDAAALFGARAAIVGVALPAATTAPPRVRVTPAGGAATDAAWATWLAPAAQADARLGANVQLYRVGRALPARAGVDVELPGAPADGVRVPSQAVVWYAGQPWVYVRRDARHFARVPLLEAREEADGYFVPTGLQPGEAVVTRGAGLLLSQERMPPPGSSGACRTADCDGD
ncbi:MAG: hypothetical protein KGN16_15945 [Burkholderiales bacterium]|nr:hypothetical protein [Burkholderiales bacterium]